MLGLAYQAFVDRLLAALASHRFDDLGRAYAYVFRALADEHHSQRELARRLGITDPRCRRGLIGRFDVQARVLAPPFQASGGHEL